MPESTSIKVVARIRPLSKSELKRGSKEAITSLSALEDSFSTKAKSADEPELVQVHLANGKNRWFELDSVFDKSSTQEGVYSKSGAKKAVCVDIFKGFNCTILAYGQTGAGKTFSMGTAAHATEISENDGIIPRACHDLFDQIKEKCDGNAVVELSYLEVYNEELRDLLVPDSMLKPLKIRETLNGEVYVSGLEYRVVKSPAEIGEIMEIASKRRVVAATAMNAVSSRSHAMCVLRINGVIEGSEDSDKFSSKLSLVDLAGSERIKKTGAQGTRVKEGININKSLMVLGQVVAALGEKDKKKKRKPPYRDSKLTRLLQDSLGGNSRTIMVACVSPADFNIDESVNCLRYATSARNIQNSATRNLVKNISPEEAKKLQRENQLLKQQVKDLQEALKMMSVAPAPEISSPTNEVLLKQQVKELQEALEILSVAPTPEVSETEVLLKQQVKKLQEALEMRSVAPTSEVSETEVLLKQQVKELQDALEMRSVAPTSEVSETEVLLKQQVKKTQDALEMMSAAPSLQVSSDGSSRVSENNDEKNNNTAVPQDQKRVEKLEMEIENLRVELVKAKKDLFESAAASDVELSALKVEIVRLQDVCKSAVELPAIKAEIARLQDVCKSAAELPAMKAEIARLQDVCKSAAELPAMKAEIVRLQDMCKSAASSVVELSALKVEIARLQDETEEVQALEAENSILREELEEVQNDAECAQHAATQLSKIMDQLKGLSEEESDRKRTRYQHLKKEEAWVHFVCQMLENNKEQIKKLSEDFALVVRVVESPMVMSKSSANPPARSKRWWGSQEDISSSQRGPVYDPGVRHQLLTEHVEFFNDRMKEVECTIDSESESLKEIRTSIRKDREKLQGEIGVNDFMKASLDRDDKDLLQQLTTMLIGPVTSVD